MWSSSTNWSALALAPVQLGRRRHAARITLQGNPTFKASHGDVEAYDPAVGDYRIYVAEPSLNQIMRYQQTLDGSAFVTPSAYLVTQAAEVADFDQLYVDFDVYALHDNDLRRYHYGRYDGGFTLAEPPDADRPAARVTTTSMVAGSGSGSDSSGRVYLYDAEHDRIVGFSKVDGSYLGQWVPGPTEPRWTICEACT